MKDVIEALNWRYATNGFDTNKKLSAEEVEYITEAMRLSPSSYGLQPWKFILVTNPEVRAKLQEVGFNQPKISEASHLVVFAIEKNIDDALVDTFIKSVADTRGMSVEMLDGYANMIKGFIAPLSPEERRAWATRQAYISLGVLVTAGATRGIDVAPMEGFDPKKFDEILGLENLGLESRVIAAVGFRSESDPSAGYKKVRFPKEQVVIEVK